MKSKSVILSLVVVVISLAISAVSFAEVPSPPVNQNLGVPDGVFNNLGEVDCRFCHEGANPNVNVEGRCSETGTVCFTDDDCTGGTDICVPVGIIDRHDLLALVPESIPGGSLIFNATCSVTTTTVCNSDADCPIGETCQNNPLPNPPYSPVDPDVNKDGVRDTIYACYSCHPDDPATPIVEFPITRDCLQCHVQIGGEGSAHHIAATSPAQENRCFVCHGDLVNLAPGFCLEGGGITQPDGERNTCVTDADCPGASNTCGDGHIIPTYDPTISTPRPSDGIGPANSYGNGRGACNFCHDQDTMPPATPILIYSNANTHHNTGIGLAGTFQCLWCHDFQGSLDIRTCENCHGYDSLHNISLDSDAMGLVDTDGDGVTDTENLGNIFPGAENPWYGHIGNNDDCLGCHGGYIPASAPGSGSVVPNINAADTTFMIAGTDKAVTLAGSAFENYSGSYLFTSNVMLTASDGSSTTLTPEAIDQGSLTVMIPGSTDIGNYNLRIAKDDGTGTGGTVDSNPVVISVIPEVAITDVSCSKRKGELTITGSGFSEKPEGTDEYIGVIVNGAQIDLISWTDTSIKASVDRCKRAAVTVKTLFGSATSGNGKPPKPCKGKGCNK